MTGTLIQRMKRTFKTLIVGSVVAVGLFVGAQAAEAAMVPAQPGDCLSCIGNRYGVSVEAMIEANRQFANPDVIFPGQLVNVPIGGPVSAPAAPAVARPAQVSGGSVPGLWNVVGRPYVWGGTTPAGFDCSGLTQYLAAQRGISIPRNSYAQGGAGRPIGRHELWAGDLVLTRSGGHVGMYIGNNQVVHAVNPAVGVIIESLDSAMMYNPGVWFRAIGH